MLGVSVVTFALTSVVPSNPLLSAIGEEGLADPETVRVYRERFGLDKPLPIQYLVYMKNLAQGDLGTSRRTGRAVREDLAEYVPASMEIAVIATFLAFVIGVSSGIVAAMFHDRVIDQVIRVVSLVGVSMPIFWLALVVFYFMTIRLGLIESTGRLGPGMEPPLRITGAYTVDSVLAGDWETFWSALTHLVLPSCVLAVYAVSLLTRFARSAALDALSHDFVRTARAKGIGEATVARRHVLRAALVPIVTVSGIVFGVLLSGTVFVESIFGFGGLGQYAYLSATALDLPAIMGITLLAAIVYITINFVVDLLYSAIDPRIRLS